jgi:hypothetical protein
VLKGRMGGEAAAPHRSYQTKAHPAVEPGHLSSNRRTGGRICFADMLHISCAVAGAADVHHARSCTPRSCTLPELDPPQSSTSAAVHPGPSNPLVWPPSPPPLQRPPPCVRALTERDLDACLNDDRREGGGGALPPEVEEKGSDGIEGNEGKGLKGMKGWEWGRRSRVLKQKGETNEGGQSRGDKKKEGRNSLEPLLAARRELGGGVGLGGGHRLRACARACV